MSIVLGLMNCDDVDGDAVSGADGDSAVIRASDVVRIGFGVVHGDTA